MGESQIFTFTNDWVYCFFFGRVYDSGLWWDRSGGIAHCSDPWIDGELIKLSTNGDILYPINFSGLCRYENHQLF